MRSKHRLIVAIDGPAGAGKSTVAKAVAVALDYVLVDTGAVYRAVAWLAQQRGVDWDDAKGLAALVADLDLDIDIEFKFAQGTNHVFVGGADVTAALRTEEISQGASQVSAVPVVRAGLLALQRRLAGDGGAVLEGRDIGTVVCPDAEVKIFLTASDAERANRRHRELLERGVAADYAAVLGDIRQRDARDSGRDVAPLRAADDAILVDSTRMSVEDVVALVRQEVTRRSP